MLTVHHLGKSQSERIVWLCEELGIPYDLKNYARDKTTMMAPPEYKALHPLGAAPIITDDNLLLAESNAIVDYIIAKHGNGRLAIAPTEPNYPEYLYWLHFVNGTLQPALGRNSMLKWGGVPADGPFMQAMNMRLDQAISLIDTQLADNAHLAGSELTAADIMMVFTLTTMRYFTPFDLAPYPHILSYLQRIAQRPAYQSAMQKGDPGMELRLT